MESCTQKIREGRNKTFQSAKDFLAPSARQLSWKSSEAGFALHRFFLNENADAFYTYSNHMLALPLEGRGWIDWKSDGKAGQQAIGIQQVTIEPAQTFWHRCRWQKMVCLTLHFDPRLLALAVHEDFDPDRVDLQGAVNLQDRLLIYLINQLHFEAEMKHPDSLHAEALVSRISAHLLESYSSSPGKLRLYEKGLSSKHLDAVRDYIENHLQERITLAQLARVAGDMSPFHFTRLFAKSLGKTPHQFVLDRRLSVARDELRSGKSSISQAAIASGFFDQSHLTHAFKKKFGITPAQLSR